MAIFDFSKTHTATEALQEVHSRMKYKYIDVVNDVLTAEKMQKYLQYFKKIFYNPDQYFSDDPLLLALDLEQEAIEALRTRFQQILGVTDKYNQIFRSQHKWYKKRKDFDDIVEGELNALLQTISEKATGIKNIDLGQKIVGSEKATIDIGAIGQDTIDKLVTGIQDKITAKQATKLLQNIKANSRSGKTDVAGYNKELVVSADIDPKFEEFINLFSNINFSIKNYKGDNQYQIHLGNTNHFKAMYASLRDLGYTKDEAVHIYSHSFYSYRKHPETISRNNDIFHLRFIYELTGAGLVTIADNKVNQLKAVDFLIYNDPTSEKIYVKSTKKMIKDIIENRSIKIINPWQGIYISKLDFN